MDIKTPEKTNTLNTQFVYIAALLVAIFCFFLLFKIKDLRQSFTEVSQRNTTLEKRHALMTDELRVSRETVDKLTEDVALAKEKIADYEFKLTQSQTTSQEMENLKVSFQRAQNQAKQFEIALKNVKEEKEYLEELLADKAKILTAGPGGSVSLGDLNVGSAASNSLFKNTGKIKALHDNTKLVIVDLGKINGIAPGTEFDVKRNNVSVATLSIVEIRDVMTACKVKHIEKNIKLAIDDFVVAH